MTQDQHQSFTSHPQIKQRGRGMQFALIVGGLVVLMVVAVGIREYVGLEGGNSVSTIETQPLFSTNEVDEDVWVAGGDSIAGKYLASRHAERSGDFGIAADLLLEILEEHPENTDMRLRAHILLVGEGRFDLARDVATKILTENDIHALANLTLAIALIKEGAFEEALGHVLNISHQGANTLLMPMLEGWTLAGMGEEDAAFESFDQLRQNSAFDALRGIHAGLLADMLGDPVRAEENYALALGNGDELPLRMVEIYVSFLTRQERWEEAETFYEKFRARMPENLLGEPLGMAIAERRPLPLLVANSQQGVAEAFFGVANVLNSGRPDIQPLIFIRHALNLMPGDAKSMFLLANILSTEERQDRAIEIYQAIDQSTPYWWFARLSIAGGLAADEAYGTAIDMLEAMVDERPERSDAAITLGNILRIKEDYGEAVQYYDTAVERLGELEERHWQLLYSRGIALERRSIAGELSQRDQDAMWTRAESDFLRALELNPNQPHVLNYLGYSWVEKGVRLDEAREMIENSVSQRPRDGYITDSMGWVLYRMREFEEAVSHLERAVELEPSDPIVNDHLGDAYWAVGRKNEALYQWNRALANDPEEDMETQIRAKISGEVEPQPTPPGKPEDI